jgi:hypothetical protein
MPCTDGSQRPIADGQAASSATEVYLRAAVACLTSRSSLAAILLLLLNDHLLKPNAPSWLTGKLSDISGLYFASFLATVSVLGAVYLSQLLCPQSGRPSRQLPYWVARLLAWTVPLATGLGFAALKLSPVTAGPILAVVEFVLGHPYVPVLDTSDLLALLVLPATVRHLDWHLFGSLSMRSAHWRPVLVRGRVPSDLLRGGGVLLAVLAVIATSPPSYARAINGLAEVVLDGRLHILYAHQSAYPRYPGANRPPTPDIYLSRDGGNTWDRVADGGQALWTSSAVPSALYLTDDVRLWQLIGDPPGRILLWPVHEMPEGFEQSNVPSHAFASGAARSLWLAVPGGIAQSSDEGRHWEIKEIPLTDGQQVVAIAPDPLYLSHLFVAAGATLWETTDDGGHWEALTTFESDLTSLAMHPASPSCLIVGGNARLWWSCDAGRTWNASPVEGLVTREISRVTFDPEDSAVAYAVAHRQALLTSRDGGSSWRTEFYGDVHDVLITRSPARRVYVANGTSGLLRNRQFGWPWVSPWEPVPSLSYGVTGIAAEFLNVLSSFVLLTTATTAGRGVLMLIRRRRRVWRMAETALWTWALAAIAVLVGSVPGLRWGGTGGTILVALSLPVSVTLLILVRPAPSARLVAGASVYAMALIGGVVGMTLFVFLTSHGPTLVSGFMAAMLIIGLLVLYARLLHGWWQGGRTRRVRLILGLTIGLMNIPLWLSVVGLADGPLIRW